MRRTSMSIGYSAGVLRANKALAEPVDYRDQALVQPRHHRLPEILGYPAVERLGNPSGNTREGIGIPTQRDGVTYDILVAGRFEERCERLRNCPLTRLVKVITRTDFVQSRVKVVVEPRLDDALYFFLGLASPCQVDCGGCRLGASNSLRVVMGDRGASRGPFQHLV